MIDSGSFPAALRRSYHYWFRPSGFDSTYQSAEGIVTFGESSVATVLTSTSITISPTTIQTVTLYDDPGFKVGWIIYLYAGLPGSDNWMLARITAYDNTDPTNVSLTFEAYQSQGSGTFDYWYVVTQFQQAPNYIQNPQYSAKELSARVYKTPTAQFNWPYATTYEDFTTSNTDILKSGYTEATYDGQTIVEEDEYDINRPYIGVTASSSRVLTSTTDTTTFDYTVDPPIINTVTTETTETKTQSHIYSSDDFDPSGAGYTAGNPAVYADGQIVNFPTPSIYTKKVDIGETYVSSSYENHFEEYPSGSGVYRPVLLISMSTSWGTATGNPISPANFFYPG
jgi:hypothetical protein